MKKGRRKGEERMGRSKERGRNTRMEKSEMKGGGGRGEDKMKRNKNH